MKNIGKNYKVENKWKNKSNIIMLILLIIFSLLALTGCNANKKGEINKSEEEQITGTKTVMIYMCGSNLESRNGLGTCNLEDLLDSEIDYKNINIVLCAGGSKKWYNEDISKSETSIYEINKARIKKVKTQGKLDMANYVTVKNFLDFTYDNYKTDEYYLMFWNHGGALDGLEHDEISENILSLSNLDKSLKESKFNKNNKKFNMVILNTCLMGSLETANILSNYAEYLTASEDAMYGASYIETFRFLDGIKASDGAIEIGKNYIDCYSNSIKKMSKNSYITFSLIDLSKIDDVVSNLDSYFKKIELDDSTFKKIVRIRYKTYEYQKRSIDYYDMVDLHQLITNLGSINSNNKSLLNAIEKAVIYNSTTDPYSKGISIYFPETTDFTDVYDTIKFSNVYKAFTKNYIRKIEGKPVTSFSLGNKNVEKIENKFSINLSEEEANEYKSSIFYIYELNDDGTYARVLQSFDTNINNSGVVSANINNTTITVVDNSDKSEFELGNLTELDKTDEYTMYSMPILLVKSDSPSVDYSQTLLVNALMILKEENNGNIEMCNVLEWKEGEEGGYLTNGAIIDIYNGDFKSIDFLKHKHQIEFDESGNFAKEGKLTESYGSEIRLNNKFSLKQTEFNKSKKYVGVFCIKDIYDNSYYSKFVNIEN